jgi:hypothetical protein
MYSKTVLAALILIVGIFMGAGDISSESKAVNRHILSEYGTYLTIDDFRETVKKALTEIEAQGGGILIIPNDVPKQFYPENTLQKTYRSPAVTIFDYREGIERVYVPPIGTNCSDGFRGGGSRIVERHLYQNLPTMGRYSSQKYLSHFRGGSSSYDQNIQKAVKKGENQKFYVPTLKGLFVGQLLVVTCHAKDYGEFERVRVKSMGIDSEGEYFIGDAQKDHPKDALAYNKNVINGMAIDDICNCDNQSMSLIVKRSNYADGDSFNIQTSLHYQGNIMSGAGDEGAVLNTAEIVHDINSFHGEVESWNPENRELIYKVSNEDGCPQKLGTSRPLINLNQKKWHTAGKIMIVPPGHAFMRPNADLNNSLIIGDKDVAWDKSVIGCFIAVNEPTEYYSVGETTGPACTARWKTMRWWHITGLEKRDDGLFNLYVERTVWWVNKKAGPVLFLRSNYTSSEKHIRKLKYIIAPGSWVSDVRNGISGNVNGSLGRAHKSDERKLLLAPAPFFGSAKDFAPGDLVTQPPGPDVYLPTGFRVRHFNAYPGIGPGRMGGDSYRAKNWSKVQAGNVISIGGPGGKLEDVLKRQKDGKPSFYSAMHIKASVENGIIFRGPVQQFAFDFWQYDGNAKKMIWRQPGGKRAVFFYVDPQTSNFVFNGGSLEVPGGTVSQKGISATKVAARNLRGINVRVKSGEKNFTCDFSSDEQDGNYSITVLPSWFTNARIANKSNKGFTVEFSTPAPDKATIDWQLIR